MFANFKFNKFALSPAFFFETWSIHTYSCRVVFSVKPACNVARSSNSRARLGAKIISEPSHPSSEALNQVSEQCGGTQSVCEFISSNFSNLKLQAALRLVETLLLHHNFWKLLPRLASCTLVHVMRRSRSACETVQNSFSVRKL